MAEPLLTSTKPFKIPESVLVVIHTPELDVLLIERADRPGYWQSVTGSKDSSEETLTATAIREVREETGIVVMQPPLSDALSNSRKRGASLNSERPDVKSNVGVAARYPQNGSEADGDRSAFPETLVDLIHLRDWQLSNCYDIYPVWRHRYAPGVTRNTEHVFSLCIPCAVPVVLSPREHLHYRWLPYREAADQCFSPSNAEAILQLPTRVAG